MQCKIWLKLALGLVFRVGLCLGLRLWLGVFKHEGEDEGFRVCVGLGLKLGVG